NGQLSVSRRQTREHPLDIRGCKLLDNVHEWPTGTDRRELPRGTHEEKALAAPDCGDERRGGFLRPHRNPAPDHTLRGLAILRSRDQVGPAVAVVAPGDEKELRQRLRLSLRRLLQSNAGFSGRRKQ